MTIDEVKQLLAAATPGPWWAQGFDGKVQVSSTSGHVAYTTTKSKIVDANANARLIAAAPDLAQLCIEQAEQLADAQVIRNAQEQTIAGYARDYNLAVTRKAELEDELAACKKDAERYRWLRDYPWVHGPTAFRSIIELQKNAFWEDAIDAAMEKKP